MRDQIIRPQTVAIQVCFTGKTIEIVAKLVRVVLILRHYYITVTFRYDSISLLPFLSLPSASVDESPPID